jgi:hypothetical protein
MPIPFLSVKAHPSNTILHQSVILLMSNFEQRELKSVATLSETDGHPSEGVVPFFWGLAAPAGSEPLHSATAHALLDRARAKAQILEERFFNVRCGERH